MSTQEEVREKYSLLKSHLKGRLRSLWAGAEAAALGRGGIKRVAEATGLSRGKRASSGGKTEELHQVEN
jgi:hypothetical protein